ncbi:hypothetical protein KC217_22605, partial [Mycobacterium tuberculosis]|nr:hypothetical protein [Mycobacterium tuberculosis]
MSDVLSKKDKKTFSVYCTEQVTPFFAWLTGAYPNNTIVGSEFLGNDLSPGQVVDGVRHEDLQCLSFKDLTCDLVISND